jgi:plasmid stabilization system protein ParE
MAFTVVLGRKAQTDIADNTTWLEATRGLRAADHWRVGLLTAVIPALETDPNRYPQAEEAADLGIDLRELLHGRRPHVFRILFTIDGDTVNVYRVRHAAQDRITEDNI